MTYGWFSFVCDGTTFHAICMVCQGADTPTSSKCLANFESHWVRWAGFPAIVNTDKGIPQQRTVRTGTEGQ